MGLWFSAEGLPDLKLLLVFVLGIFVMRWPKDWPARGTHQGQAHGGRAGKWAWGVDAVCHIGIDCLRAGANAQYPDHLPVICGCSFSSKLSVYETLYLFAAGISRHRLWLGHPHGMGRANWQHSSGQLAVVYYRCALGNGLWQYVCHGRPWGWHQDRNEIDRHPVRWRGQTDYRPDPAKRNAGFVPAGYPAIHAVALLCGAGCGVGTRCLSTIPDSTTGTDGLLSGIFE